MQWQRRESGILLHPTSLPGPHGIGEIGPEAERFAAVLHAMGQRLWQVLPMGPTSYGDSPYQSLSTFAGNDLLISFDRLVEDGLLARGRLREVAGFPADRVDYGPVIRARQAVLDSVCRTFGRRATPDQKDAFAAFCHEHAAWLEDYALFVALKNDHGGRPWTAWAPPLRDRDPRAIRQARRTFRTAIRHHKLRQFLFFDQWRRLVETCHALGLRLIGDIPIFVAHDSADVWVDRDLFHLDEEGMPTVVAGVPPDYFSEVGQRWGNPLYNWERHAETGFTWWIQRMRQVFKTVDIVRIDHFRAFEAYWEIPAQEPTAVKGRWVPAPGYALFDRLSEALDSLPIIAEDLGIITDEVEALRNHYAFPGMRILQFAFGGDPKADSYRPEHYPARCVCYTGTHDNDTTVGWFRSEEGEATTRSREAIERERQAILAYVQTDGSEIHWDMMSVAARSPSQTAIYPLQDVMGLDSSGRMNTPGIEAGNWQWRFAWEAIRPDSIRRLRELTAHSGRA